MNCCGKVICGGCIHAPVYDNQGNEVDNKKCPFCRIPLSTSDEEIITRYKKRVDMNDAIAFHNLGCHYRNGRLGLPRDHAKALELWHRASELGHAEANCNIGNAYYSGRVVEMDKKTAKHYWELAAIGGEVNARHNLGCFEEVKGNMDRALKHWMIAVRDGEHVSLKKIKQCYIDGHATKDDYTKALRSYQEYLDEIKSDQRDEAAAYDDRYKYYESAV